MGNFWLVLRKIFKSQFMVISTCENVGGNFERLGGRFDRNGGIRPIGRLGVTFLIGRLGVNGIF